MLQNNESQTMTHIFNHTTFRHIGHVQLSRIQSSPPHLRWSRILEIRCQTPQRSIFLQLEPPKWPRKVRTHMPFSLHHGLNALAARADGLFLVLCGADIDTNSQVSYCRRSSHLHGHDWLLPDDDQTSYPSPLEHAQVWSRCEEEGAIPRSDKGRKSEIIMSFQRLHTIFRAYAAEIEMMTASTFRRCRAAKFTRQPSLGTAYRVVGCHSVCYRTINHVH